jgi:hypothetical protein
LCEVNNVCKKFFDSVKTSQSQKGVRNMGTLRYQTGSVGFVAMLEAAHCLHILHSAW